MSDPMKPYDGGLRAQGMLEEQASKMNLNAQYDGLTPARWAELLNHPIDAEKDDTAYNVMGAYKNDGSVDADRNLNVIPKFAHSTKKSTKVAEMQLPTLKFNRLFEGLKRGDASPEHTSYFCPWYMLYKYADQFVGNTSRDTIKRDFTKNSLLNTRVWDFFFVSNPYSMGGTMVVPTGQVQCLFEDLNTKYGLNLDLPNGKNANLFQFCFPAYHSPPPRFLGRSTSVSDYQRYCKERPAPGEDGFTRTDTTKEIFTLLSKADDPNFTHSSKQKKIPKGPGRHRGWGRVTKRVQRYLGLRKGSPLDMKMGDGDIYLAAKKQMEIDARVDIDINKPVPFRPEGNVVFISIDLEWHEFNQRAITEVGMAILETKDLASIPPERNATGWHKLIKARHIRMKDHLTHRNYKYIVGCPDKFNFGRSEICTNSEACEELIALFESYPPNEFEIVLVGHDFGGDIKSLKQLGINIYDIPNLKEIVDSKDLHAYLRRSNNGTSVSGSLEHFTLPYKYLHNAGNDAVYTLHAALATALQKRLISLDSLNGRTTDTDFLRGHGWTSNEEEDGGDEPPLVDLEEVNGAKKKNNRSRNQSYGGMSRGNPATRGPRADATKRTEPPAPSAWGSRTNAWGSGANTWGSGTNAWGSGTNAWGSGKSGW